MKSWLQPYFRQTFATNFNYDHSGAFKYTRMIGETHSSPVGTDYSETSFAYVYKNVLIVTVDVLRQENHYTDIGPMGTVNGQVAGDHLQWLDNVLSEGSKLQEVDHIIVQAHFPVIYPVRKTKSSGIYMDDNTDSDFWKVMRKHPVDVYFAGEAHLNTASIDPQSNILQIVSRGNFFSNFLSVDFAVDAIDITLYDEQGLEKTTENFNYVASGNLRISKAGGSKSIIATGDLSLINPYDPIIYFNFESQGLIQDRHVLGLGELPNVRRSPTVTTVEVDGKDCEESLINVGVFGQDYDAQSSNVLLTSGGVYGNAGVFTTESRAAIFGMGPHSGTHPISYSLWFKTTSFGSRTLLNYEGYWSHDAVLNLRLRDGIPEVVYSASQKLVANKDGSYNNGAWHSLIVTMPFDGCKMSEMRMFIDGLKLTTSMIGVDSQIDLPNGGMMSVGGVGYGGIGNEGNFLRNGFMQGLNFEGTFDEVMVFARSLDENEITTISSAPLSFALRNKISYILNEAMCLGLDLKGTGILRTCNNLDGQQWIQDSLGYIHNKDNYDKCLVPETIGGALQVKVKNCNNEISSYFSWNLYMSSVTHIATDTLLSANMQNVVELLSESDDSLPGEAWDIVYEGGFAPSILTGTPSYSPTAFPSSNPSDSPTTLPSSTPSASPTALPSSMPSSSPTSRPSSSPSASPTWKPTTSTSPSNAPSTTPTLSTKPTFSPTRFPSISMKPSVDICRDRQGTITVGGKTKNCETAKKYPRQCRRFSALRDHCPVTCDACVSQEPAPLPDGCYDSQSDFTLESGEIKNCAEVQSNLNICSKNAARSYCPITCNVCGFPTPAPSPLPTEKEIATPPTTTPVSGPTPSPVPETTPSPIAFTPLPTPTSEPTPEPAPTYTGPCVDSETAFKMESGKTKTCANAKNNRNLCSRNAVIKNCPVTCDICKPPPICENNSESFPLINGRMITCANAIRNSNLCRKKVVRTNCPLICNSCDDWDDGDDLASDECEDKPGKILLSNNRKKNCRQARIKTSLCSKFNELQAHCPQSCGICDVNDGARLCEDSAVKVVLPNGNTKSCWQAQNDATLCKRWDEVKEGCPQTCGLCASI